MKYPLWKLYDVSFGNGKSSLHCNSSIMIITVEPPSNKTYSTKFLPIWIGTIAIWWFIVIIEIIGFMVVRNGGGFFEDYNLTFKYCLRFITNLNCCPKIKLYLVSNTYFPMSLKTFVKECTSCISTTFVETNDSLEFNGSTFTSSWTCVCTSSWFAWSSDDVVR